MTSWWLGFLVNAAVGIAAGAGASWHVGRRRRRQERRHEVRLRLVDRAGLEWMDVTCQDLAVIRRWGGQDDPPWQTLHVIPRGSEVRLQVAPAHPERP
jgi:hypothetical protein